MTRKIEMLVEERDGKTVLTCPLVGLFTPKGHGLPVRTQPLGPLGVGG